MEAQWLRYVCLLILAVHLGKYLLTHGNYFADAFNKDQIKGAISEAVTMAGTALDVLKNNFQDEKVQLMVKHILGDDQQLQGKVDRAKGEPDSPAVRLRTTICDESS